MNAPTNNFWSLDVISKTPITTIISLAAIFLLSFAGAAIAHHSVPVHYDLSTEDTVDGVITRVVWRNPHSFMELDVMSDTGEVEHWHIEMGTKNTMVRRKIDLSQLEVGDRVTVIGVMHRQTPQLMYFRACVFADGSRFELAPTGQDLSDQ
jgi:hypothetical protein